MTTLSRAHQKVFCDNKSAPDNIAQFGSLKASSISYSKDPSILQGLPAFLEGWKSAVTASNAFALQDMNGLFYLVTRQLAYLFQDGIPEWHGSTEYGLNSFCKVGAVFYMSIVASNTNNSVSDKTKWVRVFSGNITQVATTIDATSSDSFIQNGSGNRTITVNGLEDGQMITVNVQGANTNTIAWITNGLTQKTNSSYSGTMTSVNSIFTLKRLGSNVFITSAHGYS